MKISRRSVLHISGLAAAALALTGCSAAGSAALGGKLPGLLKGLAKKGETAASSEAASDMAVTPPPEGEQLDPAFGVMPEYDADILTGAERSTNSRPVAVMVNILSYLLYTKTHAFSLRNFSMKSTSLSMPSAGIAL